MFWHASVHHDGSYVDNLYPSLGDTVHLRLRLSDRAPVRRVYVRLFPDGEQHFIPMTPAETRPPVKWFACDLPITEPHVHYRFLLQTDEGIWWLTAAGLVDYEPLDHTDFRILADYHTPAWIHDSVFYQVYPDRFANGDPSNDPQPHHYEYRGHRPITLPWGAPKPPHSAFTTTFYGGDIPGIIQHLDHLEQLGINAIYLNPIMEAYSIHGYDPIDYEHVARRLGGDDALIQLRRELDRRGMHYIMDIVPNHCGFKHPWFLAAQQNPSAPEYNYFTFIKHPDDYLSWLGHQSLVKLNYQCAGLRQRMYEAPDSIMRRWLQPPFSADGWRVDVGNMLGRQGAIQMNGSIVKGMRRAVKEAHPDAYLIGENFFDASAQLQGDQWDGVMNYMGLAVPLWHWLRGYQNGAMGMSEHITSSIPYPTHALAATWRARHASLPWSILLQQYNLIGSHDTTRIRTVVNGSEALHRLSVTLQLTYPGIPALLYGDEIGLTDQPGWGAIVCMNWDQSTWNRGLLDHYRDLIALRRRSTLLQRGGFQMLATEPDTFAYQRDNADSRMIVVAHRGTDPRPTGTLPVWHGGVPDGCRFIEHFSGHEAVVEQGALHLPELPQGATIWEQI